MKPVGLTCARLSRFPSALMWSRAAGASDLERSAFVTSSVQTCIYPEQTQKAIAAAHRGQTSQAIIAVNVTRGTRFIYATPHRCKCHGATGPRRFSRALVCF
ncbi:hypothetical protein QQF64_026329 [Cirrhinus molitorella]|uniref:Secreted protein n=1 Tax=Cirrhinus molitorella TaxID=172907 RepID=A0ABR3N9A3_9TELE